MWMGPVFPREPGGGGSLPWCSWHCLRLTNKGETQPPQADGGAKLHQLGRAGRGLSYSPPCIQCPRKASSQRWPLLPTGELCVPGERKATGPPFSAKGDPAHVLRTGKGPRSSPARSSSLTTLTRHPPPFTRLPAVALLPSGTVPCTLPSPRRESTGVADPHGPVLSRGPSLRGKEAPTALNPGPKRQDKTPPRACNPTAATLSPRPRGGCSRTTHASGLQSIQRPEEQKHATPAFTFCWERVAKVWAGGGTSKER